MTHPGRVKGGGWQPFFALSVWAVGQCNIDQWAATLKDVWSVACCLLRVRKRALGPATSLLVVGLQVLRADPLVASLPMVALCLQRGPQGV